MRAVWVYTNGDSAELFLNGKTLGAKAIAAFDKGNWTVPYTPGNLTAVVKKGGKQWAVQTIETAGAAVVVQLSVDMPVQGVDSPLLADGQDLVILTATIVDAQGRTVQANPGAKVTVSVSGAGVLLGLGNGDPHDHTLEGQTGGNSRRAFSGLVRVLVKTQTAPGNIIIAADAEGLKGSSITITSG